MRLLRFWFFLLCVAAWPAVADISEQSTDNPNLIEFLGEIVYVPLEGGFYGIVGDTGDRYQPLELPNEFHQDGLQVWVSARLLSHRLGIHMWGQYIEILGIVKIKRPSLVREGRFSPADQH